MPTIFHEMKNHGGAEQITWGLAIPGDTFNAILLNGPALVAGALQAVGTFGGATVGAEVSNDGTNWFPLKDLFGTQIAMTAPGLIEFSTAALYIRPTITGGAGYSITFVIGARG